MSQERKMKKHAFIAMSLIALSLPLWSQRMGMTGGLAGSSGTIQGWAPGAMMSGWTMNGTGASNAMMSRGSMGAFGGMGGMMGSYGAVLDPPAGAAFQDPPEIASTRKGNVVEIDLTAAWTKTALNGTPATLLTFNGTYPSPTIRVRKGDILKVKFHNRLPAGSYYNILGHDLSVTNLHTHGLHVSPLGNSDNSMITVAPGEDFSYQFDLSLQDPGVLAYYHPHAHGGVAEQVFSGLGGAFVVEDATPALSKYETHLMVLKDISLSNGVPVMHTSFRDFMMGGLGDTVTVNGQVNPVLSIKPGQVQRWRILNASSARFYTLSLEGHTMYLIGTDGGLLDKPYAVDRLGLSPGERVDVLVQASGSQGSFKLLSIPDAWSMHGSSGQITLLTMKYGGTRVPDALPTVIKAGAARVTMDTSKLVKRDITLTMGMGSGSLNGIVFTAQSGGYTIESKLGTWEVWQIRNATPMAHCFHQHINEAQVLSVSGGDPAYSLLYTSIPALKDTVMIPPMGSATLLVPVMDYYGMAMFHCHILEHEDIGMMGTWNIVK